MIYLRKGLYKKKFKNKKDAILSTPLIKHSN